VSKAFASEADLIEKKVGFVRLSDNACAHAAEGDPDTAIISGDLRVIQEALAEVRAGPKIETGAKA
jgi:hypothetical protein